MANLDWTSDLGRSAQRRLRNESLIWLTTVAKDGSPFPKPVWFLWDGEAISIYSQPSALAVRHIAHSPRVSLNLDAGQGSGGVIAFTGAAACTKVERHDDAFTAKYADKIPALRRAYGDDFDVLYTVLIRIVPDRLMGH